MGVLALLVIFITLLSSINDSVQVQSTQAQTLLTIQRILDYPSALSSWDNSTDFCNTQPSFSVAVICSQNNSVTQLHIFGNKIVMSPPINNLSMELLITTLATLPSLKVLTLSSLGLWGALPANISLLSSLERLNLNSNFLNNALPRELSSLSSLWSLSLDDNTFAGELPGWIGSFPALTSLSIKNNMFNGTLPNSLANLTSLRAVALSNNYFSGEVVDFGRLTSLEVVDVANNGFESEFPYYLLAMPRITHLDVSGNKFGGRLWEDQKCAAGLEFVDLSSNLLTGHLPSCLAVKNYSRTVLFDGNCLESSGGDDDGSRQFPVSYCNNQTSMAAPRRVIDSRIAIALQVAVWIAGGIVIAGGGY